MKLKLFLIYFLIAGFFFSFSKVFAQQGCCSYHQGVQGCDSNVGRIVCNDGMYSPSCTCPIIGDSGYTPATCTYNGKTYTNFGEANFAWDSDVDKAVDRVYPIYLERQATEADYRWWENELNFNNCHAEGYTDQQIIDNVKSGEEYKHLQWLKAHKQNIRTQIILLLDRTPSDEEVNDWAEKSDNIEVIIAEIKNSKEYFRHTQPFLYYLNEYKWWILGIIGFLLVISIQYYFARKSHRQK